MKRTLTMVLAMSDDGAIGHKNKIPWAIPDDLRHFKRVTTGHPIIMGRKTHESIGKALPGRRNIVVTRGDAIRLPGIECVRSPEEAVNTAVLGGGEPHVIGGAEIYRALWPRARTVWLTEVHNVYPEADVRFHFNRGEWTEVERHPHPGFDFVRLERKP